MFLSELTGVKRYQSSNFEDLLDRLERDTKGTLKYIASGLFATVFKHTGKNLAYRFWITDRAYDNYVAFVERHQDDPHLPKLYSKVKTLTSFHKRPDLFPKKIKYVQMELLAPITAKDKVFRRDINDALTIMLTGDLELDSIQQYLNDAEKKECKEFVKEWRPTIENILREVKFQEIDLHSNNVMKRADGTYVIIDPFTFEKDVFNAEDLENAVDKLSKADEEEDR